MPRTDRGFVLPLAASPARAGLSNWLTGHLNHLLYTAARQAERWSLAGSAPLPPADLTRTAHASISVPADIDRAPYLAAADRLVAGRFDIFALHDFDAGSPPNWNRDPKSGIEAPRSFGKSINCNDPLQVGEIRYLHELNRHRHLVTLAQAHALSGDQKYFETIRRHLESWFVSCPDGQGPNWSNALEAAIRLINWSLAWQLLGGPQAKVFEGAQAATFRQRWLDSIYRHAQFIGGHFSRRAASSHLISEASGLFICALTWPHWPQAETWRADAQTMLEREVLLENSAGGISRKQAEPCRPHEIDLLLLPLLMARANGIRFSEGYESTIEQMLECLASIMDVGGNVPMLGDFGNSDNDQVVRLAHGSDDCRYRSTLATGAILFQRSDFASKAGGLDDKTRWLLGAESLPDTSAQRQRPVRKAFHERGCYILGCDFERNSEIRLSMDVGPAGYEPLAAHSHADALSFTLSAGGNEFLIDPGTYAYRTPDPWRQYFRGTSAQHLARRWRGSIAAGP